MLLVHEYRISLKSCHTSKSHRPRNVDACFCELIPINIALESRHVVEDSQLHTVYTYAHVHYTCIQIHVHVGLLETMFEH